MDNKKVRRLRRGLKNRIQAKKTADFRLCVFRSNRYLYAQVTRRGAEGEEVLVCASSLEKNLKSELQMRVNKQTAERVGVLLAERAVAAGIQTSIAFDRSGYSYHGVIQVLADAARRAGLQF